MVLWNYVLHVACQFNDVEPLNLADVISRLGASERSTRKEPSANAVDLSTISPVINVVTAEILQLLGSSEEIQSCLFPHLADGCYLVGDISGVSEAANETELLLVFLPTQENLGVVVAEDSDIHC